MLRHTECDDVVILAEFLEGELLMNLAAVNNEQHVATYSPPLICSIKCFNQAKPMMLVVQLLSLIRMRHWNFKSWYQDASWFFALKIR